MSSQPPHVCALEILTPVADNMINPLKRRVLKVEVDPEGVVTVHAPDGAEVSEIARRAAQKGSGFFANWT